MKTKFPLFLLGLALSGAAAAALTNIAQVPLLNITGTGTVKPNLMLLFDNSGSMAWAYTPDYVGSSSSQVSLLCRARAAYSAGTLVACDDGHPPYMSPDYNKQYYNPLVRYQAPIKSDGSYYNDMNAANSSNWTHVIDDGFDSTPSYTNLVTGFPDLKWCDPANPSVCNKNSATYTYPDNTYTTASAFDANPYYYTIAVAEYCSNDAMTNCQSVSAGAAAPAGYPVPVKVRWCTTRLLTTCQAKRVGSYLYPRYSTAAGALASYGTVTINASASAAALSIASISVAGVVVTNGAVTASSGTNTLLKQQSLASALAASINAKTGLTNQYMACVKTPTSAPSVSACSAYGVPVSADNVLALIAVTCSGAKSAANCTPVTDNARAGAAVGVSATVATVTPAAAVVPPTAVITVSGTTSGSGTPRVASFSWGGASVVGNINLGNNKSASNVTSTVIGAIGTGGAIRAYAAGNSVTPACQAQSGNTKICLVYTTATSNVGTPSNGTISNGGSIAFAHGAGAGYTPATAAVTDSIPSVSVALSAGSDAPSTFVRTDLIASRASYPKGGERSDCVATAGVCGYAEEMTNFGNWYAYYRTRLQMMKTSVGLAFAALGGNYRVGYVKLSNAGAGAAIDLKPADFTGTARSNWYTALYNTSTSGSTPIRAAMDGVGKMFANQSPYNYAAGAEVVQYPCQQNFMILTTDGYWNGTTAAAVDNNDNAENANRFCTAARGCVDPRAQSEPSIADVALYWYNGGSNSATVSLRPTLEPDMTRPGSVPAAGGENTHLHMNTYTLGLGVDGVMTYETNYDTAPKVGGDFYNLITGAASGCQWNGGGAYVWPDPNTSSSANTVQERVDDLWHAAINGHGKYFSASAPSEVVAGLSAAIANMSVHVGAAAAAATSTPNISQQDNDIFSDTFTTVKWYGELSDKKIDITTGVVGNTPVWVSSDTVGTKVALDSDTRSIYMLDTAPGLKSFSYAAMSDVEKAWFSNKGSLLSQYALLSAADKAVVNNGANLVNWLRGQQRYADDAVFRAYSLTPNTPAGASGPIPIVLGDIASSKPAFLRDPRKSYTRAGYAEYKVAQASRPATVFTAANDGMLHAFDAANGNERWAYAPRITMKKLALQASTTYGTNHQYSTDGSPELGDVQLPLAGVDTWRTVLVAGLNGGGRGYYALDVTDPDAPRALWELCADGAVCAHADPDLGLSFGNPQFGMWHGHWVVYLTSGYNNVPGVDGAGGGDGKGYLYIVDVADGSVLMKTSTDSGSVATPSGLAKITAISANPFTDPVTTYVYGGDNQGQMWRFDLTGAGDPVVRQLGDAGALQPITTRPDVSTCAVEQFDAAGASLGVAAQRVVLFGSGRLLDVPDTSNTDIQSLYLLKDSGSLIAVRGAGMVEQTLSLLGSGGNTNTYRVSANAVDLAHKDGWFIDWKLNAGERMNLDPKIVSGGVSAVTNIPSSSSACSVGGTSNVYQVGLCSGSYIGADTIAGGTLSNTSAAVGFIIIRLPSGALKMITTTAAGNTITTGVAPVNSEAAHKVGWRRLSN